MTTVMPVPVRPPAQLRPDRPVRPGRRRPDLAVWAADVFEWLIDLPVHTVALIVAVMAAELLVMLALL